MAGSGHRYEDSAIAFSKSWLKVATRGGRALTARLRSEVAALDLAGHVHAARGLVGSRHEDLKASETPCGLPDGTPSFTQETRMASRLGPPRRT